MAQHHHHRHYSHGNYKKKTSFWSWYWAQYRGRWYQRIITPIATFFILFFLFMAAVDVNFLWLFGKSPSLSELENSKYSEASLIYSSDNVLIGKYFTENRTAVPYEDISPYVVQALISTEDERFYHHNGVDYQGILGAIKDIVKGNPRGASTITQQLAKNMFKMRLEKNTNGLLCKVPVLKTLIMKAKEWNMAYKIENMYTKKEILTLYLNTVDFGSNAYGIKTAAKTYFNAKPKELTIEQAATLIGLLKATTMYNPMINPDNSRQRRDIVIDNMYRHNMISLSEAEEAKAKPIELHLNIENAFDGQAQYFREAVKDYLREWLAYNEYNLYEDGLKIYTTVDTRMQRYAEQAVAKQMNYLQGQFDKHWNGQAPWRDKNGRVIKNFIENVAKQSTYYKELQARYMDTPDSIDYYMNLPHKVKLFSYTGSNRSVERTMSAMDSIRYMLKYLHCGFVAMEPQSSHVKAWVGDVDFSTWKYDKVRSPRQPGSTFKLFVYGAAFELLGLVPMDRRIDTAKPIKYKDSNNHTNTWRVRNSGGHSSEQQVTLRTAFAKSINTIAARLGLEVGTSNLITIAKRMGIKSQLEPTPAIALGSCEVSLIDMVDAYACVMNEGMRRPPILVTRIEDREGNVVYDADRDVDPAEKAISYRTSYFLQQLLLAGTHDQGGTSRRIWQFVDSTKCDVGGKTGTTSNYSDAWFIGCTPNLVGGAWIGGEYRSIHFRNGSLGQGARTSLPVFGYFMSKVLADSDLSQYRARFKPPRNFIAPSSYSNYTPPTREDLGDYYDDPQPSHTPQPPTPQYRPDTTRRRQPQQDISQGIDVGNAEEQQPVETQVEEDFF